MNKSLPQILTAEQARQLIQRYFDAETSEQEEAALKQFIASPEGADAQFNEVRAVMGVAICDALVFPKTNLPDRTIRLTTRRKRFTLTSRHVWQRALLFACRCCWPEVSHSQDIFTNKITDVWLTFMAKR